MSTRSPRPDAERIGGAPIRLGALAPLTRPGWVEAGQHLLAGLQLAAHDVNAAGGIAGRPVELVVRDTAADPRTAERAVDELAGLGVVAVAGEYHSVVARAVAARAGALGLPFLCSSAVLDTLVEEPTDRIARLAAPQSRGWQTYADHLLQSGHRRVAVATQASVYWAAGLAILRDRLGSRGGTVVELDTHTMAGAALCAALVGTRATALVLLVGFPEPAVSIVRAVRRDARLAGITIGAPAGQPEFAEWVRLLGVEGAAVPFLRYLPEHLTPLGVRVEAALRERLAGPPSFVALEGYDTITVLADVLRRHGAELRQVTDVWARIDVDGTRGRIRFSPPPRSGVWQWESAPIQVVDRDPEQLDSLRVLRAQP